MWKTNHCARNPLFRWFHFSGYIFLDESNQIAEVLITRGFEVGHFFAGTLEVLEHFPDKKGEVRSYLIYHLYPHVRMLLVVASPVDGIALRTEAQLDVCWCSCGMAI